MDGAIAISDTQPLKLLYVDDDPILREFALVHLAADGASVAVASDGEDGLSAVAQAQPDIMLLDLKMPKMDGFQVLQTLRADEATRRLPVIVITGSNDEESIERAFAYGATSFIAKPINWPLLVHQVRFVDRARRNERLLVDQIDVIERRERQLQQTSAELAEALRAAAAASEAKSQFLATVSHELRTPLNAIIGFSELIKSEQLGPVGNASYKEFAGDILRSGTHLLSLVNDVLEFTAGDSKKLALQEAEFPVAAVIEEALQIVSYQAMAAAIDLSYRGASSDRSGEAAVLCGDRRRIRQVLVNLLSNALKYTPAGGSVVVTDRLTANGLTIAVADTGIGIAAADISTVLQPFGRIDNSLARQTEGVGLGLPLATQLMERHGGRLDIDSIVDVGTTVTVTFPCDRVVAATSASAP